MDDAGYRVYGADPDVLRWAEAAARVTDTLDLTPDRHGGTWCAGVDALPNAPDGSVEGVPLTGPWAADIDAGGRWHRAQVSVVHPGYPRQDPDESDAAHRFRRDRDAAHMDGLLPEGPKRRRHLREPHAFILGLPLGQVLSAPLVVWPGSHRIMRKAFQKAFEGLAPESYGEADVTEVYQASRREVFDRCPRTPVPLRAGESVVMHRMLIHGVAPWQGPPVAGGRAVAYFRPLTDPGDWLSAA